MPERATLPRTGDIRLEFCDSDGLLRVVIAAARLRDVVDTDANNLNAWLNEWGALCDALDALPAVVS